MYLVYSDSTRFEGYVYYGSLFATKTSNQYILFSPFNLVSQRVPSALNFRNKKKDYVPSSKFIIEEC